MNNKFLLILYVRNQLINILILITRQLLIFLILLNNLKIIQLSFNFLGIFGAPHDWGNPLQTHQQQTAQPQTWHGIQVSLALPAAGTQTPQQQLAAQDGQIHKAGHSPNQHHKDLLPGLRKTSGHRLVDIQPLQAVCPTHSPHLNCAIDQDFKSMRLQVAVGLPLAYTCPSSLHTKNTDKFQEQQKGKKQY